MRTGPDTVPPYSFCFRGRALLPEGVADRVVGVEFVVLQVLKKTAVEVVGAGLEGKGDGAAGEAVLRGLIVGDNLELADGVDGRVIERDVSLQGRC